MLTVRFPDGTAVQYNQANYLVCGSTEVSLYSKKDGQWIASILNSSGAIVEGSTPCRVYDGRKTTEQLQSLVPRLRELTSHSDCQVLVEMKRELENFDARRRCWKE
ncbi:MAG TPA: hypothetical protein VJU84_08715 [Pyrinomonadaceae bacterium]|nr:hypothetical protein [Pyrinomonadaceae bacterium]